MKLSTNPAVWRVALGAIVAALIQLGLLTPEIGERLDGTVAGLASAVTILLPVAAAWWSKSRTAPVGPDTTAVKELFRGTDGVYRSAADHRLHTIAERADIDRELNI